ncbi:MAG: hypothetical protein ABGY96_11545 [bacterium]|nr:hypothetical protein [Gammaproteobacteria bacterium]
MNKEDLSPAAREILGPGGAYALEEVDIRCVRMQVFKNAPPHLRDYFQAALENADAIITANYKLDYRRRQLRKVLSN